MLKLLGERGARGVPAGLPHHSFKYCKNDPHAFAAAPGDRSPTTHPCPNLHPSTSSIRRQPAPLAAEACRHERPSHHLQPASAGGGVHLVSATGWGGVGCVAGRAQLVPRPAWAYGRAHQRTKAHLPACPNRSGLFLVIIIAIYTAGTAARLTAAQLEGSIRGREDLKGRAVGTCARSRPAAPLPRRGVVPGSGERTKIPHSACGPLQGGRAMREMVWAERVPARPQGPTMCRAWRPPESQRSGCPGRRPPTRRRCSTGCARAR